MESHWAQLAADLTRERERIQRQIADLQTSLKSLDRVIDAATQPDDESD
ncbi:hypothetical protein JOJ86_003113 [Rhodococcus percolatus]|nr:hypothetical protein [Rhodococcus opacus]MBA8959822.1 hypothetical protein [Rhodococcus opacus]MBP2205387.1 hypothetical protein [Rhodococcus opacus]